MSQNTYNIYGEKIGVMEEFETRIHTKESDIEMYVNYYKAGILSLNEVRKRLGFNELPGMEE